MDDESILDTVPLESNQSTSSEELRTPPFARANANAHNFFPPVPRSDSPYATQPQSVETRQELPVHMITRSASLPIVGAGERAFLMRRNATATCANVALTSDAKLQDPEEQFQMSFRPGSSGGGKQ
ncbi:MAG: hypothetical protein SFW07_08130 [Gammaproteobacteria bacterium]|nr:hypothetical protein [Gammaproteobacteria bacterium]